MPIQTNRVTASLKTNPNVKTTVKTQDHLGGSAVGSSNEVEARVMGITGQQGETGATGDTGGQGIQGIQGDVGMIWMGEYDPSAIYQSRNVVSYYGSSYIFIADTPQSGIIPTDLNFWEVIASKGDQGNAGSGTDQHSQYTKDPSGFENRVDSAFFVNDINHTFTVQPTIFGSIYNVFVTGNIFSKSTPDLITFNDHEGLHYFYFDINGDIQVSRSFPDLENIALIAVIYWSVSKSTSIWIGDERHGVSMDWATQEYLHNTRGCVYSSGLDISYSLINDGTNDEQLKIGLDEGVIYDEDMKFIIPAQQPNALLPIYYHTTNGDWDFYPATQYPVHFGTNTIQYNRFNSTWTVEDVVDEKYACMWVFATHKISQPLIAIMGQNTASTIEDCENKNAYNLLNLDGLPYQDIKALYRIIYKIDTTFTNSLKCKMVLLSDFRWLNDNKNVDLNVFGGSDKHYRHQQHTADTTWMVNHNLEKFPSVVIIDSGGNEVEGEINYLDINTLEIYFSVPFGGEAFCN